MLPRSLPVLLAEQTSRRSAVLRSRSGPGAKTPGCGQARPRLVVAVKAAGVAVFHPEPDRSTP